MTDGNGCAFPFAGYVVSSEMTLRDYFAAHIVAGALIAGIAEVLERRSEDRANAEAVLVRDCYRLADTMMAERAK